MKLSLSWSTSWKLALLTQTLEVEGKSGGYRTIICFRHNDRAFFVFGFPKSTRGNISQGELTDLKKLAKTILDMDWAGIEEGMARGKFFEVGVNNENI